MGKENEVSGGGNAQNEGSARGSGRELEGILPGFAREKGRELEDFPPGITTPQMTPKAVERGEKGSANEEEMEGMEVEENTGGGVNRKKRRASDLYDEEDHQGGETTEDEGGSGKKARGDEDEIERDMRGCSDEAPWENPLECEEKGCFVDFHDQCQLCQKSLCFDHHWKHYCLDDEEDDEEEEEGAMEVEEEEELLAPTQLVAPEGDPEKSPEEAKGDDVPLLQPVGLLAREEPTPPKETPTQGLERQMEAMMKLMMEMRTDNIKLIMRVQDLERSSAAREGRRIEGGAEESKCGRMEEDKEDWEDPVGKREDPVGKKGAGEVRRPPPPGNKKERRKGSETQEGTKRKRKVKGEEVVIEQLPRQRLKETVSPSRKYSVIRVAINTTEEEIKGSMWERNTKVLGTRFLMRGMHYITTSSMIGGSMVEVVIPEERVAEFKEQITNEAEMEIIEDVDRMVKVPWEGKVPGQRKKEDDTDIEDLIVRRLAAFLAKNDDVYVRSAILEGHPESRKTGALVREERMREIREQLNRNG
jgi:hypothetical protein